MTDYKFQPTEEVTYGENSGFDWIAGWVKFRVVDSSVKESKNGYPQIDVKFIVSEGVLEGKKATLFLTIPPKARAFNTNGTFTFWGRRFVWFLDAMDCLPFDMDYPEDEAMMGFLQGLNLLDKIVVSKVKPAMATITDQRTGDPKEIKVAEIERLQKSSYEPEEGFIEDAPMSKGKDKGYDLTPDTEGPYVDTDEKDEEFLID